MVYVVIAVVIVGLAYAGWKMTSRSAYESAEYSVVKSDGKIELREYPDLMMATTEMHSRQGNDGSFGRLFRYISGGNEDKQKVAMTTPVFMETNSEKTSGTMGFVIPKNVVEENIPEPASEQVQIAQRPGGLFAVIRFAGRDGQELFEEQQSILEEWLQIQGYEIDGEPEFAGYDPPWTPGPLRRNEILIRIRAD